MKKLKYPKTTKGTKIAAKARTKANKWTAEEREKLFAKSLELIDLGELINYRCRCGYLYGIRKKHIEEIFNNIWKNVICTKCGRRMNEDILSKKTI